MRAQAKQIVFDPVECRERATECEREAARAVEPTLRDIYAQLAKKWRETAARSERQRL